MQKHDQQKHGLSAWKRLSGEISAKEKVTVPAQISWSMQEPLLRNVSIPLRVVLWFLCLLRVRDAQTLLLPLAQTSPAQATPSTPQSSSGIAWLNIWVPKYLWWDPTLESSNTALNLGANEE